MLEAKNVLHTRFSIDLCGYIGNPTHVFKKFSIRKRSLTPNTVPFGINGSLQMLLKIGKMVIKEMYSVPDSFCLI